MEAQFIEDKVCICLAKFATRSKLGFGAVVCGQSKCFPIEVVLPAAKNVPGIKLHVQLQYQRGRQPPLVLTTDGERVPHGSDVSVPDGSDRVELRVMYTPDLEDTDGVLGSIVLQCQAGGILLKGELSVTAKAVPCSAPATQNGAATNRLLSSSVSSLPPPRGVGAVPQAPTRQAKPPAPRQPVPPLPLPQHSRSHAVATPAASIKSFKAPIEPLRLPATPAPTAANPAPATPLMLRRFMEAGETVPDSPADSAPSPSGHEDDVRPPDNRDQSADVRPSGRAHAPPHVPGVPLKRSLSLATPRGSVVAPPSVSGARAGPAAGSQTPRGSIRDGLAPPASRAGSVAGRSIAPSMSARSRVSVMTERQQAQHSPGVQARTARSYMQMHTEEPLKKQEHALKAWLNLHLEPPVSQTSADDVGGMAQQRLSAQAQGMLWRLYKQDPHVFDCLKVVYTKIDAGILTLTDAPLVMDIQALKHMVDVVLSYHPFWLRAGLVVVLRGDLVRGSRPGGDPGASLTSAMRKGLPVLVREGLLCEREVKVALDQRACWADHRALILRNFLLLVLLLDRALTQPPDGVKLPHGVPPLFRVDAKHKSSAEVVRAFLTGRLNGIGDVIHHLEKWGYRLRAVCAPVDEYEWKVMSLNQDLKTGVRLAKMYEQLTGFRTLVTASSSLLWLHPTTDQQSMENMARVIEKFQMLGVLPHLGQRIMTSSGPIPLRTRDLIEAHREATLGVLWAIALKWALPQLVPRQALATETRRLLRVAAARLKRPAPVPLDVCPGQPLLNELMRWVQAACCGHGLRVGNLTNAFGDGRALCYVVNAYLPEIMPLESIYQPDAPKPEDVAVLIEGDEDVDLETLRTKGWCAVYEAGGFIDDSGHLRSFKEGVQRNFDLLHAASRTLGRVPEMLRGDDFLNGGVDEKSVILFVAHLAGRLLELSTEYRAAHVIITALRKRVWERKYGPAQQHQAASVVQKYWRRLLAMRALITRRRQTQEEAEQERLRQLRDDAAVKIQAMWRGWLARKLSVKALQHLMHFQAAWRARAVYRPLLRLREAALVVQCIARARWARREASQTRWAATTMQACWRAGAARKRFTELQQAAITMQSCCRAMTARRNLALHRLAASLLQAAWRRVRAQRQLQEARHAATTLQAAWRAKVVRQGYSAQYEAVVRLQAAWRGRTQALESARVRTAAVAVQAAWRAGRVQTQLRTWHAAAARVQAGWRGMQARREGHTRQQAVVRLQAAWRGRITRRRLGMQQAAAMKVQAAWRGHAARVAYRTQVRAVVEIQAAWRAAAARRWLQEQRDAVTALQTAWRGYKARRALADELDAATCLQAAWRGVCVRRTVRQWHQSAAKVQAGWRGMQARREAWQWRAAATMLQAAWRAVCVRKPFSADRQAVVRVQAAWRGLQVRREILAQHKAATCIQAAWKGLQARQGLHRGRAAATQLQAAWRGVQVRMRLRAWHKAATRIQAAWAGARVRQDVQDKATAGMCIQAAWRARQVRVAHGQVRAAAVLAQAAWRSMVVRRDVAGLRDGATAVQAAWRALAVRQKVRAWHGAARSIQAVWQGHKAVREWNAQRTACIHMQCAVRRWLASRQLHQGVSAATVMQTAWRRHHAQQHWSQQRWAASMLQAAYRGFAVRREIAMQRKACTQIQTVWRGHKARQLVALHHHAAQTIQQQWRVWKATCQRRDHIQAVVLLQAAVRAFLGRQRLQQARMAATALQAAVRSWAARQELCRHLAARRIQSVWRGSSVRQWLQGQHRAAAKVQAVWRGRVQRVAYVGERDAVVRAQAAVRGWAARRALADAKVAACILQSAWRARLARKQLERERAAVKVQSAWRGLQARRGLDRARAAAGMLQAAWRGRCERQAFVLLREGVVLFQAVVRTWMAQGAAELRRGAIVTIQAHWRRQLAIREAQALRALQHNAATTLQAAVRGFLARRRAHLRRWLVVQVQARVRGHQARREAAKRRVELELRALAKQFMQSYRSACLIQAWWRGHLVRQQLGPVLKQLKQQRLEKQAVQIIERAYLAHRQRQQYHRTRTAMSVISRHVPLMRQWLGKLWRGREKQRQEGAAIVLQSYVRGWLVRKWVAKTLQRLVRVQAVWRGWRVRRFDGKVKAEVRRKLAAAAEWTARNPHKTLGARVRDALEQLLSRKDPAQLSMAIAAMETGTRYSVACCELIAKEEGAVALLRLVRQLNRSKPHVDLLIAVLAVLTNICRHKQLIPLVLAAQDSIIILSERLQFFRDNEEVFMPVVALVAKLLTAPEAPAKVAAMPGVLKQWEGIGQILLRRVEMERKYICRLEGQKGSDASAKEATRKLLAAGKQMEALQGVIAMVNAAAEAHGIQVEHHNVVPHSGVSGIGVTAMASLPDPSSSGSVASSQVPAVPSTARGWQPKNTLVRGVLREVNQQNHLTALHQQQQQAAAVAAAQCNPIAALAARVMAADNMVAEVVQAAEVAVSSPRSLGSSISTTASGHFAGMKLHHHGAPGGAGTGGQGIVGGLQGSPRATPVAPPTRSSALSNAGALSSRMAHVGVPGAAVAVVATHGPQQLTTTYHKHPQPAPGGALPHTTTYPPPPPLLTNLIASAPGLLGADDATGAALQGSVSITSPTPATGKGGQSIHRTEPFEALSPAAAAVAAMSAARPSRLPSFHPGAAAGGPDTGAGTVAGGLVPALSLAGIRTAHVSGATPAASRGSQSSRLYR